MNYSLRALVTPIRKNTKFHFEDISLSTAQTKTNNINTTQQVDYKTKAFELMDQVTQIKTKHTKYQAQIEALKQNINNMCKQLNSFLKRAQCQDLTQALQIIRQLKNYKDFNQQTTKNQNINLKQKVLEYKLKYQQVNQQSERKYGQLFQKKLQFYQKNSMNQIEIINKENNILKQQLSQIKYEYQKAICQNSQLREQIQKLREDMIKSIKNYEQIQFAVEQKMHQYIIKLRQYEEIINRDKKQDDQVHKSSEKQQVLNQIKQQQDEQKVLKVDFSFGKITQSEYEQVKSKTKSQNGKQQIQELQMSIECYKASIQGLLQENKRLKKSFLALNKLKQGEDVPQQIAKQVNIMKSIIQLNENLQNI